MKRTRPSRSRGYSGAIGSLTLSSSSASPQTSSTRRDARADRGVRVVGERAALARAALDEHLVAVLDELARARRGQRDAVLVGLDLLDDADLHGRETLASGGISHRRVRDSVVAHSSRSRHPPVARLLVTIASGRRPGEPNYRALVVFVSVGPRRPLAARRAALVRAQPGRPPAPRSRARARVSRGGMTTSTRSSESAHFSSACGQVSTPASRAAPGRRRRRPVQERPLAERAHDDHGDAELRRERQQPLLALALAAGSAAPGRVWKRPVRKRALELAEARRRRSA